MKEFKLPDIGEGVHEGEIVRWLVKEGDPIAEEQLMVEVMTDKATVQIPCPWNGRVSKLLAKQGEVVKTGAGIILIEESGGSSGPDAAPTVPASVEHIPVAPPAAAEETVVAAENVLAAPVVRKLARELGVDLTKVKPTGAFGRITEEDVKGSAKPSAAPAAPAVRMPVAPPPETKREPPAVFEKPATLVVQPPAIPKPEPRPEPPAVIERPSPPVAQQPALPRPEPRPEPPALIERPPTPVVHLPAFPRPEPRPEPPAVIERPATPVVHAPALPRTEPRPEPPPAVRTPAPAPPEARPVPPPVIEKVPQAREFEPAAPVLKPAPAPVQPAPAVQEPRPAIPAVSVPAQVPARPVVELVAPAGHVPKGGAEERIAVAGLRKRILEKMHTSKTSAAHFTYVEEIDMTSLVHLKQKSAEAAQKRGVKLTYLPFIVKACVAALKQHPTLNSTLDEAAGEIIVKKYYNIGVAVATDEGLTVVVVHDADKKDLWEIASEVDRLATAARERKARIEELTGSTFTITSLGVAGGMFATPIINHPEVAIIGIHKIEKRPVVRDETVVVREMMYLSCSFDHRVIDGHVGAAFVQTLKEHLEHPALVFLGA